jgi:UDP-glucose 4-epimerase
MLPDPVSPYAVQKMASELYMNCFAKAYGLETVCLRYFNVFGPRQDPSSPYSGVISRFITAMVEGRSPTIFGDGEQSRDFVFVDNVVQANLLAVSAPAEDVVGESFNIGTGERFTLNRTFETLRGIIGFKGNPDYAPPRPGDILHSQADISRAGRYLKYAPKVTFEEGLRQTFAWYKTQALASEKAVTGAPSR